jgi:Cytosolic domain of 10TM putative phosphate transporter
LWYITYELLHFKTIRQGYLRRPEIASQLAQRTILLTSIPSEMLNVAKLTEIFGPSVEKVRINRDHKDLEQMVEDRDKAAKFLEGAETKLIKKVNKIAIKKGRKEVPEDYDKNITTLYIPDKKRPHNRLQYPVINLVFGRKVRLHMSFIDGRSIRLNGLEASLHV